MEYTIKDISQKVVKSETTLYKLMKKNRELAELLKDEKNKRIDRLTNIVYYSENVYNWFCAYYEIEKTIEKAQPRQKTEDKAVNAPDDTAPLEDAEIEYYKSRIRKLKKRVKHLKAENERLIAENDRLLTLLEQGQKHLEGVIVGFIAEKKEKHLLLEEPDKVKKHWWSRGRK